MPFVSLSQAARMADVSRSTLYERINAGQLSTTTDERGKRVVDVAELIRVFGNNLKLDDQGSRNSVQPDSAEQPESVGQKGVVESSEGVSPDSLRMVQLEAELSGLRALLAAKDETIQAMRDAQQLLRQQLEAATREKVLLLEGPASAGRGGFLGLFRRRG